MDELQAAVLARRQRPARIALKILLSAGLLITPVPAAWQLAFGVAWLLSLSGIAGFVVWTRATQNS